MKSTENILKSVLFIVLGILLCCSVINPDSLLSWLVSIACIVGGSVLILMSLIASRSLLTETGMSGALTLALGIFFLPPLPGGQNIYWMGGISMVMMVVGAAYMLDSVLGFTTKRSAVNNIIILVLGAAAFTIGICLWLIADFRAYAGLMLGIFLIVYGVFLLVATLLHKDIVVIDVSKKKSK